MTASPESAGCRASSGPVSQTFASMPGFTFSMCSGDRCPSTTSFSECGVISSSVPPGCTTAPGPWTESDRIWPVTGERISVRGQFLLGDGDTRLDTG